MPNPELPALSRRERQIMDILIRLGQVSASDVRSELPDAPSDSAVRTMLSRLEAPVIGPRCTEADIIALAQQGAWKLRILDLRRENERTG